MTELNQQQREDLETAARYLSCDGELVASEADRIAAFLRELSSWNRRPSPAPQDQLHAAIMNLPLPNTIDTTGGAGYRLGYIDGRHAAAELALSHPAAGLAQSAQARPQIDERASPQAPSEQQTIAYMWVEGHRSPDTPFGPGEYDEETCFDTSPPKPGTPYIELVERRAALLAPPTAKVQAPEPPLVSLRKGEDGSLVCADCHKHPPWKWAHNQPSEPWPDQQCPGNLAHGDCGGKLLPVVAVAPPTVGAAPDDTTWQYRIRRPDGSLTDWSEPKPAPCPYLTGQQLASGWTYEVRAAQAVVED